MAMVYLSRETFRAVPSYSKDSVGWDDAQGQAVSKCMNDAYNDYSYAMDSAEKHAEAFDAMRKKIDATLSKPEPTLKSR